MGSTDETISADMYHVFSSGRTESGHPLKCQDLHSEKFEMNEEVDSLLSEKVSNFLLT